MEKRQIIVGDDVTTFDMLNKDIIKVYLSYLNKYDNMTKRERSCYCDLFDVVSHPVLKVNAEIDPSELEGKLI